MRKISPIPLIVIAFCCSCASFNRSSTLKLGAPIERGETTGLQTYSPPSGPLTLEWPVDTISISRGFKHKGRPHHGIDFRGELNTPIKAAHTGVVVYVGRGFSGYGKMVLIEYNSKWATLYAHLNSFSVKQGDVVNQGDIIGEMGSTGRSTGVHLHFELLQKKLPINPMPLLKTH